MVKEISLLCKSFKDSEHSQYNFDYLVYDISIVYNLPGYGILVSNSVFFISVVATTRYFISI